MVMKPPANAAEIIDELGDIEKKLEPLKKLKTRRDQLRAQVLGWTEKLEPNKGQIFDGLRFAVHISPRSSQCSIRSMAKLSEKVGMKAFLTHCSFTLGKAKELLSGDDFKKLTVEGQTGPRDVSIVPRVPAPTQRKAA